MLFPYAALSLLYYAGLYLLGQEPLLLRDTDQFMEHIGEFNVWYRLLMIASIVLYLAFLFRLTWRYKEVYRQWCHDNYSDQKNIDISWLRRYGIGVALIGVAYFWLLFNGSTYCLIVHNLTVQCFFCYTLYKGLFHDNPYTEDFFRHTLDETDARREAELREERLSANHADSPGDESIFLRKLPAYRDQVTRWMAEKKPYLNGNFKLMDVSEVLPLNRTYLSRVFNDGFGDSFSSVVRGYRMREAEEMLVSHRDIPVGQVRASYAASRPLRFSTALSYRVTAALLRTAIADNRPRSNPLAGSASCKSPFHASFLRIANLISRNGNDPTAISRHFCVLKFLSVLRIFIRTRRSRRKQT